MSGKPVFSDLFTLSGRRNRRSYFLFLLAEAALLSASLAIATAVEALFNHERGAMSDFLLYCFAVFWLAVIASAWIVSAQRFRDFGWTGWSVLLFVIPLVDLILLLVLLFRRGCDGANRYGLNPLRSS